MSTKAESAKEVRKHSQSLKAFLASGSSAIGEADTRAAFIDPLLKSLGYQSIADVQREVYVKDTKEFLDYVLLIDGKPRIGVEAKALKKESDGCRRGPGHPVLQHSRHRMGGRDRKRARMAALSPVRQDGSCRKAPLQPRPRWVEHAGSIRVSVRTTVAREQGGIRGSDGPLAWLRAQQLDAALRDALTNDSSTEVKYLRKRLADKHIRASDQDVAAWFKGKLLEAPPASASWSDEPMIAEAAVPYVPPAPPTPSVHAPATGISHWLVPAGPRPGGMTGEQSLQYWLSKDMWGFWESTPGRKSIQAGDRIAFYASDRKVRAVIAHAIAAGPANLLVTPAEWPEPVAQDKPVYKQPLTGVTWLDRRLKLTELAFRARLDAFKKADPAKPPGDGSW